VACENLFDKLQIFSVAKSGLNTTRIVKQKPLYVEYCVIFIDKLGTTITFPYDGTGSRCGVHWPCESCLPTHVELYISPVSQVAELQVIVTFSIIC